VIADPARLRLLSLIQAQPDHDACVCNLTEPLGLSQPTVSRHLKVLPDAALSSTSNAAAGPTTALLATS
jgi:ArsR family transcriptional regulator, arsenate/arsenite/antimonite-responsive transcriptional repressor